MRNSLLFVLFGVICSAGCRQPSPAAATPLPANSAMIAAGSAVNDPSAAPVALAPSIETLVDVTAGTTGTSNNYVGQSVTIPDHGAYKEIRFNWYQTNGNPTAFGTLFLLDQEYLGTPLNLGTSTPGFIAQSVSISGGQYLFDPKVKIKGGTHYWFYTDSTGAFATGFTADTYAGGDMYLTGMPGLAFHRITTTPIGGYVDANFRLQAR